MAATQTFQNVIHMIQTCSLNYRIELSPFSATIHLKNSFLKDQNGNTLHSNNPFKIKKENEDLHDQISNQANAIRFLQNSYEKVISDSKDLYQTKEKLENEIEILNSKLLACRTENEDLSMELHNSALDAKTLNSYSLEEQKQELLDMVACHNKLNEVNETLQREINNDKERAKAELDDSTKKLKVEIKSWRKELGEERKANIKLEKKLESIAKQHESMNKPESNYEAAEPEPPTSTLTSSEDCTICAEEIPNYIPKYFNGIEINPSCDDCQDPSLPLPCKPNMFPINLPSLATTSMTSTASLDMIGLDFTSLGTTSINSFTSDTTQANSVQSTKSLFPQWTCKDCQKDIPSDQTWEQVLHTKKHRDEAKD